MDLAPALEKLQDRHGVNHHALWMVTRLGGPHLLAPLLEAAKKTPPGHGVIEALARWPSATDAEAELVRRALEDAFAVKGVLTRPCVEGLARLARPESIAVFTRLLVEGWQSPDFTSRLLAIVGLARIGTPASVPALAHALTGKVGGSFLFLDTCSWDQLRERTAESLPCKGAGNVHVPTLAAWALGKTRVPEALPPLVEALQRTFGEETFYETAVAALLQVTPDYMEHLRPLLPKLAKEGLAVLALTNPSAHLQEFRAALGDSREWVRFGAAYGLAAAGWNEGVPVLRELLRKWLTDPPLRRAVLDAAGRLRIRELLPEIFEKATGKDAELRDAAAGALQSILEEMSTDELLALAHPERWSKKDVAACVQSILASGPVVRTPAVVGLLRAAESTLAPALDQALDGGAILRSRRALADLLVDSGLARDPSPWLRRVDDRNPWGADFALVVMSVSSNPAYETRLLELLEQVPTTGSIGKLFRVDKTKKPDYVRRKVMTCLALATCGTEAAIGPLLKWTGDPNPNIRAAAAAALVEVGLRHLAASRAAGVPGALLPLWSVESYSLRAALARYFGEVGWAPSASILAGAAEEIYGSGPFARYREVLCAALARLGASVPPPPSPERERELLTRDVGADPLEEERFRELLRFETLMKHLILDYEKPESVHMAFEVLAASQAPCCALCLAQAERKVAVSFSETVSGVGGLKERTRTVGVPVCSACGHSWEGSTFTPASFPEKDGARVPAFINRRYGTMVVDNAWLATGTYSARRIFMAGLADVERTDPSALEPLTTA